ncbi:MAG TPA: hypothetical protein VMV47_02770 [Bacteroidales bacterium]|nr:hypothetical protein [Bacteroidales bacterium]
MNTLNRFVVLQNANGGSIFIGKNDKGEIVPRETATRDLKEMINKKLFKPSGQKGAGAFYTLN